MPRDVRSTVSQKRQFAMSRRLPTSVQMIGLMAAARKTNESAAVCRLSIAKIKAGRMGQPHLHRARLLRNARYAKKTIQNSAIANHTSFHSVTVYSQIG